MLTINFSQAGNISGVQGKVLVSLYSENFLAKTTTHDEQENRSALAVATQDFEFKATKNEYCVVSSDNKDRFSYQIFYGLGKEEELDPISLEKVGVKVLQCLTTLKVKTAVVVLNAEIKSDGSIDKSYEFTYKDSETLATSIAMGMQLASYRFNKYYTEDKLKEHTLSLSTIEFVVADSLLANDRYSINQLVIGNMEFLRNLVSTPANDLNPENYAELCVNTLKPLGVEVKVYGAKEMAKMGMHSLLAVGQGSCFESKLVVMEWHGSNSGAAPVALVGKGVTYDSGGLSIKPSNCMDYMFTDMAGSGVVVATLKLLAERKAKVNAVGVIGLVENSISSHAQRPGDVVGSLSGQTIEVKNTDAEGRMVLADALYYTQSTYKPQLMIDLATLTGAICVALDSGYAGLFSNNDNLCHELVNAGKKVNEEVWRMPLSPIGNGYDKKIDSPIADVSNTGDDRYGGATTAAQFLQRFINGHPRWAHLDIAGTAWLEKDGPFGKRGATGYGVRLLNRLIGDYYEDKEQ